MDKWRYYEPGQPWLDELPGHRIVLHWCVLQGPTCEAELTYFPDALSLFYLTRIHNDENSRSILKHLKTDEYVNHDYSDCLRPEYTIPGLIASLLDACSNTTNKISYGFWPDNRGNANEQTRIKYYYPIRVNTTLLVGNTGNRERYW